MFEQQVWHGNPIWCSLAMLTVFLHPHSSQRVRHSPRGWNMLPLVWAWVGKGCPLTGMPTVMGTASHVQSVRETRSPWQEWVGAYPPLGECPLNSSLRFEPRDLWSHELVLGVDSLTCHLSRICQGQALGVFLSSPMPEACWITEKSADRSCHTFAAI